MAASIVGEVVGLVLLAYAVLGGMWAVRQHRKIQELEEEARRARTTPAPEPHAPLLSEEMTARLIERLLDAALPKPREEVGEERVRSDAEYEPPMEQVGDWTDPFFAVDRPLVAGLSPGQGIPGIGAEADDSPYNDHDSLTHDEQVQAMGEELFDAWERGR